MSQIKGPALFLAQFMGDEEPFNSLPAITAWAKSLGYEGVQIPSWDGRCIDIQRAAESKDYCDEIKGQCNGLEITELASHLQGQLVACHPAYNELFDAFAPEAVRGNPEARAEWATDQLKNVAKASANMELTVSPSFTGALLWPYLYPWPQRPAGLIEEGFKELANRWQPILDYAEDLGVCYAYELHPGEDVFDGATFEKFLGATGDHSSVAINYDPSHFVLQCLDYVRFIDTYAPYIRAYHVKDAAQGAAEGAPFIEQCLIDVPTKAFDDFAGADSDSARNRRVLGLN